MLVNKSIVIIRLKTFQNKSDSRASAMRVEANPTGRLRQMVNRLSSFTRLYAVEGCATVISDSSNSQRSDL